MALLDAGDLLRGAGRDDLAPAVATLGAEVYHVVGGADHVQVVLDDDDGVAGVHESVQDGEELLHVGEVQPRRRLVEDVDGVAGGPLAELARELYPLGLTARERRGGLAEPDVAEAHVPQRLHAAADRRHGGEELAGFVHGHLQDVGDGPALVGDAQSFGVVAATLTDLAGDVDVWEEVHLYTDLPVPPASLASPALDVEAEPARLVAPDLRLRRRREELPDVVEDLRVRRRVRARRPPDGALVYVYDLVHTLHASQPRVPPRPVLAAAHGVGEGFVQDLVHQRALPRPRYPRHAREHAQRELDVHVLEVVLHRPEELYSTGRLAPRLGRLDAPPPRQEVAGDGAFLGLDVLDIPLSHDLAAVYPSAGTDVHQIIGGPYRLLVVLDDYQRVPQVPQLRERVEQPAIVALVQPDGGLVEDVEDAHEPAPDLAGEPYPLSLAAGEGTGRAAQGEVAEAHVHEEPEAFTYLLHDPLGDDPLARRELDTLEESLRVRHAEPGELVDVLVPHGDGQSLGPEPRAIALRARHVAHELLDLLAPVLRVGLRVAPLEVPHHAVELRHVLPPPTVAVAVGDVDPLAPGPVQDEVLVLLGQVAPPRVEVYPVLLGQALQHARVVLDPGVGPRHDRALVHAQVLVRDQKVGVYLQPAPEPVAAVARPVRAVERERPRLYLRDGRSTVRARKVLAEQHGIARAVALDGLHLHESLGQPERRLYRVGQPALYPLAHHEPVNDDLDVVLVVLVQAQLDGQLVQLAVHPHAGEALLGEVLQQLPILAFAAPHDRRHDHEARLLWQGQYLLDHLLRGRGGDGEAADVAVWPAGASVEEAEVVVDLRDRRHGRARVVGRGLLVYGDRGRQTVYVVHVGLVHLAEELPRVGGEALDVASLALGVDSVEGEAGFATPGEPRDDDHDVARDGDGYVLQVVLACAPHDDVAVGDLFSPLSRRAFSGKYTAPAREAK